MFVTRCCMFVSALADDDPGYAASTTDGALLAATSTDTSGMFTLPPSSAPWTQATAPPTDVTAGLEAKLLQGMPGRSLVNNLIQEGYDTGFSLPSLPSVGEDFPSDMQSEVVIANETGQGVAAEETVSSSDAPPPTAAVTSRAPPPPQQQPSFHAVISQAQAAAAPPAFNPVSLERKLDEFQNFSQNVS